MLKIRDLGIKLPTPEMMPLPDEANPWIRHASGQWTPCGVCTLSIPCSADADKAKPKPKPKSKGSSKPTPKPKPKPKSKTSGYDGITARQVAQLKAHLQRRLTELN
jgi:hypothetical protein